MIVDLYPHRLVFLDDERALVCSLAEQAGGHLRCPVSDPRLDPLRTLFEELEALLGRPACVCTLNSRASDWHRDASSHERAVVAWLVFGRTQGGDLRWRESEGWERTYSPENGDVAIVNARDFEHRIDEIVVEHPNAVRASIVLA